MYVVNIIIVLLFADLMELLYLNNNVKYKILFDSFFRDDLKDYNTL